MIAALPACACEAISGKGPTVVGVGRDRELPGASVWKRDVESVLLS
jgi:hypothetical protein